MVNVLKYRLDLAHSGGFLFLAISYVTEMNTKTHFTRRVKTTHRHSIDILQNLYFTIQFLEVDQSIFSDNPEGKNVLVNFKNIVSQ